MLSLPAVTFQHTACHSYLFSLFYFIGREFILRCFYEKQYRNTVQYVRRASISKHSNTLCSSCKKSKPSNCVSLKWWKWLESEHWIYVILLISLLSFVETVFWAARYINIRCTLRLFVLLAQILRIWNLSLKFNMVVHNLPISPQPWLYKWQKCNRYVQGRFLDSSPRAKLANDIHSDIVQYKWGTLNDLN